MVTVASRLYKGKPLQGCMLGHWWVTPTLALFFDLSLLNLISDLSCDHVVATYQWTIAYQVEDLIAHWTFLTSDCSAEASDRLDWTHVVRTLCEEGTLGAHGLAGGWCVWSGRGGIWADSIQGFRHAIPSCGLATVDGHGSYKGWRYLRRFSGGQLFCTSWMKLCIGWLHCGLAYVMSTQLRV